MHTGLIYDRCVRAAAIILALALVHACATTPTDREAGDVTMSGNSKSVDEPANDHEKTDAVTSASPQKSDNGASFGWQLLAALGLIADTRRARASGLSNRPRSGTAGIDPPGCGREYR